MPPFFLKGERLAVVRSGDMGVGQEETYLEQIPKHGGTLVTAAVAAPDIAAWTVSSSPQLRLVVGDQPTIGRIALGLGVQEVVLAAHIGKGALRIISHRWLQSCLRERALVNDAGFQLVLGGAGSVRAVLREVEGTAAAGVTDAHPRAVGDVAGRVPSDGAVPPSKRARAVDFAAVGRSGAGGLSAAGIAAAARAAVSGAGAVGGAAAAAGAGTAAAAPASALAASPAAASTDASAWRGAAYFQPANRLFSWGELTLAQRFSGTQLVPAFEGLTRLVLPPRAPGRGLARILSYNVHGITSERARGLATVLASFDVVALQETLRPHAVVHALLSPLGFVVFTHARARASSTFGVALALRDTLAKGAAVTHRDFVSLNPPITAAMTAALNVHRSLTVDVPRLGGTIVVFHRPAGIGTSSKKWMMTFLAHVRALVGNGRRVMLYGDLNAMPARMRNDSEGTTELHPSQALRALGMRDATEGTSEFHHPSHFPRPRTYDFQRLDYILLCPRAAAALVPCSGRVLSVGAPWDDHVPIEATLHLPEPGGSGDGGY